MDQESHSKRAGYRASARVLLGLVLSMLFAATGSASEQNAPAEPGPTAESAAESGVAVEQSDARLRFVFGPFPVDADVPDKLPLDWVSQPEDEVSPADDDAWRADMSLLQADVRAMERDGGAWDEGLVELLGELGRMQASSGDHLGAVQTFDRAMHVNRIRSGLNTLEQVPIIEQMIDSYLAVGDWQQVDLYYEYLFYIQQKAYGPTDPRMIPVIDKFADWQLRAFQAGFGDSMGRRLSTAQILLNAASKLVLTHFGLADDRYMRFMSRLAASAYLVTENPQLITEANRADFRMVQEELLSSLQQPGGGVIYGRQAGLEALSSIVARQREIGANPIDIAEAITHLADWTLMYDRRSVAEDLYREAWSLLQPEEGQERSPEQQAKHQELFGDIVKIPAFSDGPVSLFRVGDSDRALADLQMGVVDIRFDVTDSGYARRVEVVAGETEANEDMLARIRRDVRESRFRPRMADGLPVDSSDNVFRFQYWY
jgi:hypothetical protein